VAVLALIFTAALVGATDVALRLIVGASVTRISQSDCGDASRGNCKLLDDDLNYYNLILLLVDFDSRSSQRQKFYNKFIKMGEYLSTPNKTKHSSEGENSRFKYGASSMQGWRKSNEDAHITAVDFIPDHSLFAVFDGHGGSEVAKFCGNHFVEEIKNDPSFQARNYE